MPEQTRARAHSGGSCVARSESRYTRRVQPAALAGVLSGPLRYEGSGVSRTIASPRDWVRAAIHGFGAGSANGGIPRTPNIAHFCMTVDKFELDRVLKALADFGV